MKEIKKMNTNMKEMNLEDMEAVNGGINWKRVSNQFGQEDVWYALFLGPIGQGIVAVKAIAAIKHDLSD